MSTQSLSYSARNKATIIKLSLLVLFALLLHFKHLDFVTEWLNTASLHHQNQAYLDKAHELATTDITHFTELLAVTEVARSSEVGVSFFASFNVDVGNILHSFSTLLEKGIEVLLASLSAIEVLALLDNLANWLSPFLFKVAILTTILYYVTKLLLKPKSISTKTLQFCQLAVGLFLLAHIALPYSIHLSSLVSQELTQTKRQDISLSLKHTHHEFASTKKRSSLKDNAETSLHHLKTMPRKHITHKVSNLSKHIFTSIALNVFDLLIMPVLLLLLLNKFCMKIISIQQNNPGTAKTILTNEKKELTKAKNKIDTEKDLTSIDNSITQKEKPTGTNPISTDSRRHAAHATKQAIIEI